MIPDLQGGEIDIPGGDVLTENSRIEADLRQGLKALVALQGQQGNFPVTGSGVGVMLHPDSGNQPDFRDRSLGAPAGAAANRFDPGCGFS